MKKNLFLLSSAMMVSLLLTACLSQEEEAAEPVESTEQATTQEESAPDESESSEEATEAEETIEETTTEGTAEIPGTLTQNDGKNYELYVQDGYELSAEEPRKDVLYVTDNSAVFMRIETFTLDEAEFELVADSMKQTLAAVNPDEDSIEVTNFDYTDATQSMALSTSSSEGIVTGIVYELENLIVRLTIFDDSTVNATDDFIAMGKTIQAIQ